MLFSRKRKTRSAVTIALMASLAFMALAVWGWGMPLAKVGEFLWISLVLIVGLMLAAVAVVAIMKLLQRLRSHD